eukprot:5181791-Amphidinium_carterae.1
MREVRSGGNQDHVIDVLAHFNMPSGALQSAYQERMQEVNRKTTPGRKYTGTLHGFTHRALYEDAPAATVHVQSTVKGIERKAAFNSELLKLSQRHPLVALRAV